MKNKIIRPLFFVTVCFLHISLFAQNVGVNTTTPVGKLHIKGSENISQLIIEANSTQTNANPLIRLRKSTGLDLLWLHSDDSTNTFLGLKAGLSNIIGPQGVNNTFIGTHAAYSNTNGRDNTVIGYNALYLNTKGGRNVVVGASALYTQSFNGGGGFYNSNNVAVGYEALYANQPTSPATGGANTAIGTQALRNNVTGSRNTALGNNANVSATNLNNATAIGNNALVASSNAMVLGGTGFDAVKVGIGVNSPRAVLDVNGDVVFRSSDLTVADGTSLSLDVNTSKYSNYRLTGPTADFTLAGISSGVHDRVITLLNSTGFSMLLNNNDVAAASIDRIITGSNGSITLDTMGMVTMRYDTVKQKWIVNSTNKAGGGGGAWVDSGENIYFDNYVGIGTENPTAPLSIETGLNEAGISHTYNSGATTITSTITDVGASIGTSTDDIFSLAAGGDAKVHVWPNGNVVIGDDADPLNFAGNNTSRTTPIEAKLTIETPINSAGWIHIGGPDSIIVSEGIGGVSAALGTLSNHAFRLNSNGQGRLHIYQDGNIVVGTNAQATYGKFTVHTPNNTNGVIQVGGDGQVLAMRIGGSSGSIGTATPHIMRIIANNIAAINIDPAGNIGIGTPNPLPGYMVAINGNVKAKELVIETTGWPDYVFGEKYQPMPLHELNQFITQHHHLPNIPSACELETDGVAVGEMQKKMMEKIEELTLYLIQQQKEIEELKATLSSLKN